MLWFTLTAHWSIGSSSFTLKLQTPETAHSEGIETEGNSGRQVFFFQKHVFWNSYIHLLGKDPSMSPLNQYNNLVCYILCQIIDLFTVRWLAVHYPIHHVTQSTYQRSKVMPVL
jgi:hypothetical protein